MRNEKTRNVSRPAAFFVMPHILLMVATAIGLVAANADVAAAYDRQARDQALLAAGDVASPGTEQQRPDLGDPSEDGTDGPPSAENPDTAIPEAPPGCIYRDGPLELVV